MVTCAIFGCTGNNNKKVKRNINNNDSEVVKYFSFPKEKKMVKLWILNCHRKDVINPQNARVCSKHFTPEHYVRNLKHKLLNYSPKSSKKLNPNAIPTENLPYSSAITNLPPGSASNTKRSERILKRNMKSLVKELFEKQNDELIEVEMNYPNLKSVHSELLIMHENEPTNIEIKEDIIDPLLILKQYDKSTDTVDLETERKPNIGSLLKEYKNLQIKKFQLEQENSKVLKMFTESLRQKTQNGGTRTIWKIDEVSQAYEIYISDPKTYEYLLEKGYPLPAVITLKNWAKKFDILPELLADVSDN